MPPPRKKPKPTKAQARKPGLRQLPPPRKAKRPRGRPTYEPTTEQRNLVEMAVGIGVPEGDIAKVLKISPTTLRKHFRPELDIGLIKANLLVGQSLFRKAVGNGQQSVAAAIFWVKVRMGWKEHQIIEHAGKLEIVNPKMSAREAAEAYGETRRHKT